MKVESKSGASNGQYNITVNKLATTSRFEGEFTDATSSLIDADGQLTFTAGVSGKSFTVDVKAGDSLQSIRSRINSDGDNFGLTANIITTANGTAKLVFDSGVSGEGNNLSVAASTSELKIFDPTITDAELNALPHASAVVAKIKKTQDATSAVIDVDGTALKSASNVFEDTIQGLKITLLRTSDTDSTGKLKSNKVAITTDTSGIKEMVQKFIDGYNTLLDKTASLGKRNSIVAGESQDDGGDLAGDSITRLISSFITKSLFTPSTETTTFSTVFEMGVEMDKNGKLSLDSEKFSEVLDTNFEQVVALFGGENGIAAKMATGLKQYTQSGGIIAARQDGLNTQLRYFSQKQSAVTTQLTKYEEALRVQYGNLDAMLVKMNQSVSYLSMLSTSSS